MFGKKVMVVTLSMLLVIALCGAASATTLRIAHGAPEKAAIQSGFVKFKEVLEKETNGDIEVQIFNNGQLGQDRELAEACQMGNVDIVGITTSNFSSFAPEFYLLDLPFSFPNHEVVYKVLDGEFGDFLEKRLTPKNLKLLVFMENGFRQLSNSQHKVATPADLEGLKIRVMGNPIHIAAWKALGANPAPLSFGELFTALQQGAFDGQENGWELTVTNRFYEVQDYYTQTNYLYGAYIFMMNQETFDSFSPEEQEAIVKAAKAAQDYERSVARENDAKAKAIIEKEHEIVVPSADAMAKFRELSSGAAETEALKHISQEDLDYFKECISKAEGK